MGIAIAESREEDRLLASLRSRADAARDLGAVLTALIETDAAAVASFDPARSDSILRRVAGYGVWVCPTLTDLRAYTVMTDSLPGDERLGFLPDAMRESWSAEAAGMS